MKRKTIALLLTVFAFISAVSCTEKEKERQTVPAATEELSSDIQNATTEPVTEPEPTEAETESVIHDLTELDYYQLPDIEYEAETALFGDEGFGFVELPIDWSKVAYEVQERPCVTYESGDKNKRVIIWNIEEIDETVKTYYQIHTKHDGTPDVFRCEINGYKAYRSSYVNEDGNHVVEWDIERPRSRGWHMKFMGGEDISALADCAVQSVYKEHGHVRSKGESLIIGEVDFGYLEVSQDWECEPPDDHRKPVLRYTDSEGNRIIMKSYEKGGFPVADSVKELAEIYYDMYCDSFENVEMIESKIDGFEAYKISFNRADAVNEVNYGDEDNAKWVFECADGVTRCVVFSGSEDLTEMSDRIMETYHLYLADQLK